MNRWLLGIILVVVALGGVGTAQADYEDGQRAWDAGRHSKALREWQASANAGDAKAMLALGRLYVQGLGVPQNYVQAHMWFSLAASRGEAEAVTERDALAARMAPEQVAEAQKQAAAWQPQSAPAPAPAATGTAGSPPPKAIREAQQLLAVLGYEPDSDGQWGERTAQAYQAFVRDANLPKTDTLTPSALKTMRARARQAGAPSAPQPTAALPPEALHRAAKAGNLKGLEAALAAGAAVNARDDKGWTALMYVVDKGYVLLVEPVLTAQADPDVRAPDGATALFMAVAHGHLEIIPLLMRAGADPTIKGPKGKTATEIAQARYGDLETAIKDLGTFDAAMIPLLSGQTWEAFMFKFAQGKGTSEAYTEYLSAFPQGRHVNEAKDSRAFVQAQVQGTVEAYAEYIAAYPSGRHVEEARRGQEAVDDAAFDRAQSLGTEKAYAGYIASHPSGRHIEKARLRQAEREKPPVSLTATSPAGTTGRECDACPEMVVVPGGRFRMGDLSGDGWSDERPVRDVTVSPFAAGKYEVTFAEWDACVAGGGCTHRPADEGWGRGTRPVIHVSWDDIQAYVRWLSRETGNPYRLLSEAEWEYVARAGSTTKYHWGNNVGTNKANCDGCGSQWDDKSTAPVGSFEPNAFGLFDTAGNVYEWVADCWHDSYQGAPNDGSVWAGGNCDRRVWRGGSWSDLPGGSRSAFRSGVDSRNRSGVNGFRVARTLELATN